MDSPVPECALHMCKKKPLGRHPLVVCDSLARRQRTQSVLDEAKKRLTMSVEERRGLLPGRGGAGSTSEDFSKVGRKR